MTTAVEPDSPPRASDYSRRTPPSGLVRAGALWRLLRPVRGRLFACAGLSGLGAAAGLLPYIAVAEIAQLVLVPAPADSAAIGRWVVIGAAGAIARIVLLFGSSRLGHYVDADALHHVRRLIVHALGRLPMGWFRQTGSARVKRTLTNDLEAMHQLIAHALGETVAATVSITLGLIYLSSIDWRLTVVTATVLLLMVIAYRVAMRSMSGHMAALVAASTRISGIGIEYADGIEVAKTYGRDRLLARFDAAVADHTQAMRAWVAETRYSSAASRLLSGEMALFAAVTVVGLWLLAQDMLAITDLIPFLVVGIGLPTSINPAIQGAQGVREGRMSAARVEQLLTEPGLPEPTQPLPPTGHDLDFDHVSFSYDGVTNAIDDLTAACPAGSLTAVVGPSGAGKSTLAALVPRFYDVTGGAIRIGGVDIRAMDPAQLLASMSLVFQDTMLVNDTITNNIRLARPHTSDAAVRAAAEEARVHDVIERLPDGYDTVLGDDGGGLSGGERQRLTIARAILSEAPIVILDEATAALDPDNEAEVQAAISRLTGGRTVIVIAHRLHTITHADQILVLDGGHLVQAGTHTQLLAEPHGRYRALWDAQLPTAASAHREPR